MDFRIAEQLEQAQAPLFVVTLIALFVIESIARARPHPTHRWRHTGRNMTLVALALGLGAAAALWTSTVIGWAEERHIGLLRMVPIPDPARALLGVALYDLSGYCIHRAKHQVPFLWRIHRAHHSDPELDVTSAIRFHPFELVLNVPLISLLVTALGISRLSLALYLALSIPLNLLQHANVRFPRAIDRALRLVLSTPSVHQTHHSRVRSETDSCFADVFSFWDRLLGTFRIAEPSTLHFGVDEQYDRDDRQSVRGLLSHPFYAE
jgi:sterol desaturase/sphingolipid hydroxylase (fatty acid hydroxylase superfamily)